MHPLFKVLTWLVLTACISWIGIIFLEVCAMCIANFELPRGLPSIIEQKVVATSLAILAAIWIEKRVTKNAPMSQIARHSENLLLVAGLLLSVVHTLSYKIELSPMASFLLPYLFAVLTIFYSTSVKYRQFSN